jgi:hypothetical protein
MNQHAIVTRIGGMVGARNSFANDFPRATFRNLLWLAADEETDDWSRKTKLQDMATIWTDRQICLWRSRLLAGA